MALKHQIDQLKQDLSEHVEILEHIRAVPETEAVSVIRRLRRTPNASMVLSSFRGSAHAAARLSEQKTSRAIASPAALETEPESSVLRRSVSPALAPLDLDGLDVDSVFPPLSPPSPPASMHLIDERPSPALDLTMAPPSPLRGARSRQVSPVAGPVPDRQYCDPRLNHLNMGFWTRIPISDEFAACVLSYYFESDHPIFPCVDADLFLSGLVDHTLEHCSPFLVSALLSFACVCTFLRPMAANYLTNGNSNHTLGST